MPAKREASYELAKGIGIILVVYGHVVRGVDSAGLQPSSAMLLSVDLVYTFHMPLFFFLSGLFLAHSLNSRGRPGLIANKVDTLIYPYILWSLLQGGIEIILSKFTSGSVTVMEVLSFLWAPRAQFWFLYILFLIFIISALVYRNQSKWTLWIVFGCTAILKIFLSRLPDVAHLPFIFNYMIYFSLGALLATHMPLLFKYDKIVALISGTLFVVCQYAVHSGRLEWTGTFNDLIGAVLAIVSIVFTVSLSSVLSKFRAARFLAVTGQKSMHIYLMHILIGSGVRVGLQKVFHVSHPVIHIILGCIFALLLPIWFANLFDTSKRRLYLFSPPAFLSVGKRFPGRNRGASSQSSKR